MRCIPFSCLPPAMACDMSQRLQRRPGQSCNASAPISRLDSVSPHRHPDRVDHCPVHCHTQPQTPQAAMQAAIARPAVQLAARRSYSTPVFQPAPQRLVARRAARVATVAEGGSRVCAIVLKAPPWPQIDTLHARRVPMLRRETGWGPLGEAALSPPQLPPLPARQHLLLLPHCPPCLQSPPRASLCRGATWRPPRPSRPTARTRSATRSSTLMA